MMDFFTSGVLIAAGAGGESGPSLVGLLVYIAFVVAIILGLMAWAKKGLNNRVLKHPMAAAFEQLYLFVENLAVGIIGSHGRKYIPMLFVFWVMIFVSNIVALGFPTAPTADLGFNMGLALIAIGYVQYEGMRQNGIIGHFSHFAGPKMGLALIPINGMLFVIELISEAMKNVSLSLRLYGNIDGGHRAAVAMNELGKDIYIPFGAFLMPIKMLTCVVQALIFCLLLCVYISLVTHGDDHGHGHDDDHAHDDHGTKDALPA
jgi:F-type H+-transporting ATPase subunit a